MKTNGLNVDTKAIACGLYKIICERDQAAIVAFGMLPADIMESTDKMLCEKIIAIAAKQNGISPEVLELTGLVDQTKVKKIAQEIMHEISVEIYRCASKAGKMCV
jgi:hypothetical protein